MTSFFLFFSFFIQELIIAEERLDPGIIFIFEGAVKDQIYPEALHLKEEETNIHIEARVNWDVENIPKGAVAGGFIPYLTITAKIINQSTGMKSFIDLTPHINLIDNFHYARNISLPGRDSDLYTVEFNILPPYSNIVAVHQDWKSSFSEKIFKETFFIYKNVNFKKISRASRK